MLSTILLDCGEENKGQCTSKLYLAAGKLLMWAKTGPLAGLQGLQMEDLARLCIFLLYSPILFVDFIASFYIRLEMTQKDIPIF